jgi:Zn-finger nucleic acid-binding protein
MHLKPGEDSFKCDYCQSVYFPEKNEDGVRVLEASDENCPVCNVALSQAALAKTRILYCTRCRGMLISMEVFKNLIEEEQILQGGSMIQPAADTSDLQRKINCPQCHRQMDTHLYDGPGNVVIDSCDQCLLNWLDRGELAHIVHAPDELNPATMADLGSSRDEDSDL